MLEDRKSGPVREYLSVSFDFSQSVTQTDRHCPYKDFPKNVIRFIKISGFSSIKGKSFQASPWILFDKRRKVKGLGEQDVLFLEFISNIKEAASPQSICYNF
ncbi:hypothetical protein Ocin01_10894 [Orchesella cincta]|uniref:Uncharacterized protein n=1 Tax=Orchesella cincta TaxID=48709 RepID=A0A1D2MRS4_ORCCI|nr:hypothetical protein Ocin01_10894 [Orchesella cincta]